MSNKNNKHRFDKQQAQKQEVAEDYEIQTASGMQELDASCFGIGCGMEASNEQDCGNACGCNCEASNEQDCGNACGCNCEASNEQDCGNACGCNCEASNEQDCGNACGCNCEASNEQDCGNACGCNCEASEEQLDMEENCMRNTARCTRTDVNCGDNSKEQNMVDHCDAIECD